MKLNALYLCLIALVFSSCGKDNKVGIPNETANANAFTANILATAGMPKSKEAISFTQKKYYLTESGFKCSYRIDSEIIVTRVGPSNIRLLTRHMSFETGRNSVYCPYFHPTLEGIDRQDLTHAQFVEQVTRKISNGLNPGQFCLENNNWCTAARTLSQTDTTKNGIPATLVEAEFQSREGHIYQSKTYISKSSLLQNVFHFEMRDIRTGEVIDYKRLKHRTDRRPRPDRPRRRPVRR